MCMDFFEHQDQARRNSKKLIVLFVLAVMGVMISVYMLMAVAITGYSMKKTESGQNIDPVDLFTDWRILLLIGGGTLLFVGGASLFRISAVIPPPP